MEFHSHSFHSSTSISRSFLAQNLQQLSGMKPLIQFLFLQVCVVLSLAQPSKVQAETTYNRLVESPLELVDLVYNARCANDPSHEDLIKIKRFNAVKAVFGDVVAIQMDKYRAERSNPILRSLESLTIKFDAYIYFQRSSTPLILQSCSITTKGYHLGRETNQKPNSVFIFYGNERFKEAPLPR